MMVREWTSAYDVFNYYFHIASMDVEKTLRAYGLIKGKALPSSISTKWRDLKTKYTEEYQRAKQDYLESMGVTEPSILQKLVNIVDNAVLDRDKIHGIEVLYKIMSSSSDSALIHQADTLKIEIIKNDPIDLEEVMTCYDENGNVTTWSEGSGVDGSES